MASNTSNKKNKPIKLITPQGILKYPKLREIDYGSEKHPIPEGVYQTQLILNTAEEGVGAFLKKLDDLMEQSKAEAEEQLAEMAVKSRKGIEEKGGLVANKPYSIIYDEETEEPTGEVELRVKKRATFKKKDGTKEITPPPPLFDSSKPPTRVKSGHYTAIKSRKDWNSSHEPSRSSATTSSSLTCPYYKKCIRTLPRKARSWIRWFCHVCSGRRLTRRITRLSRRGCCQRSSWAAIHWKPLAIVSRNGRAIMRRR